MIRSAALTAIVLLLASCSMARRGSEDEIEIPVEMFGSPASAGQPVDFDLFPCYTIMPGDILDILFHFNTSEDREFVILPQDIIEVKFPDVPELNEEQRIRPDGLISLPYVGDVKAIGLTPEKLQKLVRGLYESVLNNPEVYITVKEYGGKILELKESIRNAPRGQSKLITVRSDGYATFPLIGDLKVAGETISKVGEIINVEFHKITSDVRVDLLLHQAAGARIFVIGAVSDPGAYKIDRPVNVIEALALAGGPRSDARLSETLIMRREGDKMVCKRVNLKNILGAKRKAVQIVMSADNILYVPRTKDAKAAEIVRNIGDILFFKGWSLGLDYDLTPEEQQ